jgi:hypothetical protein
MPKFVGLFPVEKVPKALQLMLSPVILPNLILYTSSPSDSSTLRTNESGVHERGNSIAVVTCN